MKTPVKRVLIVGCNGLLGQKLSELFTLCGHFDVLLASQEEESVFPDEVLPYVRLDITRRQDVQKVVDELEPGVIINVAAVTDVDLCEKERELAWRVNVGGVENLAYAAKLVGASVIHLSTDYVFDGKNGPYDESARPSPLGYYGKTKLASENVLRTSEIPYTLVRTMILYGTGLNVKPNFALWLIKNLSEGKPVRVVDDQIGNPTLVDDLAYAILNIVELNRTGLYHIAGRDLVSRYDYALALARIFNFDKNLITPMKTSALKQLAPRPLKSGFITLKAETELGAKPSGIDHGLEVLKNQLEARANNISEYAGSLKRHMYPS
ncbi:MAG: dTDP-4-dehydrorhamnose reductase [Bacteroidota bacterium]|jgi:dTDP-4-dehydrorhamnose reductase